MIVAVERERGLKISDPKGTRTQTSAMSVQCSTIWAITPNGGESRCGSTIRPIQIYSKIWYRGKAWQIQTYATLMQCSNICATQLSYDPRSYERNLCNCVYTEAWKIHDFIGVWTRDLAILVRRSNQLSYEAICQNWIFPGFYIGACINCVHNCEDHRLLDFTSAVLYMKHFIHHFTSQLCYCYTNNIS